MKYMAVVCTIFLLCIANANAREFSASEERVLEAYLAFYGRPADPGGLAFWSEYLENQGGNINSIIDAFGKSSEFQERFGSLDNTQLVSNLYQQLFGRDPDQGGLDYYVGKLNSNEMSLQAISMAILSGVKGNDLDIVTNRLDFSKYYVADTSENKQALSSEVLAAKNSINYRR